MRKPTSWFLIWSDTNQAVQLQKMVKGLKFLCSENKRANQLLAYAKRWFSHDAAHYDIGAGRDQLSFFITDPYPQCIVNMPICTCNDYIL